MTAQALTAEEAKQAELTQLMDDGAITDEQAFRRGWKGWPKPNTPEQAQDLRIVACEACSTEGRVLVTMPGEWDPEDRGPCPYCEGTGGEIIKTQSIEMEDLDHA